MQAGIWAIPHSGAIRSRFAALMGNDEFDGDKLDEVAVMEF